MKKFVHLSDEGTAKIISSTPFDVIDYGGNKKVIEAPDNLEIDQRMPRAKGPMRLAYVCNWDQHCGISTYSRFVFDELEKKLGSSKIFSEHSMLGLQLEQRGIVYCWKRGEPLHILVKEILAYDPTHILIQHEWGIFPNAAYFMQFILELKRYNIPVIVVLHSVYDHLDKQIPLSVLDNVIVHSTAAYGVLRELKFKGKINIIPHGCPEVNQAEALFNTFKTPYLIFGYGFGFKYKGVENAIHAIAHLKESDPKFKNILYIYACSESENNLGIHQNYYHDLNRLVLEKGVEDNVILIKGFVEPVLLDIYLRTAKMVVLPYVNDPGGVRGSSGAVKIAMSYNIPVIASNSHLFDDVDGSIIRANDYLELAEQIDKVFSDKNYRDEMVEKAHAYISANTWEISAERYLGVLEGA